MSKINGLEVKREIIEYKLKSAEKLALVSGFVRVGFSLIKRGGGGLELCLDCQTDFVREYIAGLMFELFKVTPSAGEQGFSDKPSELVFGDGEKLLKALDIQKGCEGFELNGISDKFKDTAPQYARGVFLGCGSISVPKAETAKTQKSGGYHLEFSFATEALANDFIGLLSEFNIYGHLTLRGEKYIVYVKDSGDVSDCLALIGANKTVIKLYEAVAAFDVKSDINRKLNCEMANIDRTVSAAVSVTDALDIIEKKAGLDVLDAKLKEAAEYRKHYPQMPLGRLAELMGISKSGLKHRFDRIVSLAAEYSGENGEI